MLTPTTGWGGLRGPRGMEGDTEGTGGEKVSVVFFTDQPGFEKGVWAWVSQQKFSPKPTLPKQEIQNKTGGKIPSSKWIQELGKTVAISQCVCTSFYILSTSCSFPGSQLRIPALPPQDVSSCQITECLPWCWSSVSRRQDSSLMVS